MSGYQEGTTNYQPRVARPYRNPVQTETLVNLYKDGLSTVKIGRLIGMSQFGVWHRLRKAGVPSRVRKPTDINKIIQLRQAGLTLARIAKIIDITPKSVSLRLKRAGARQ